MAEVSKGDAIAILKRDNPAASLGEITIYAEAFVEYQTAAANLAQYGTIVAHPRTGAPIENPYSAVKSRAVKTLAVVSRVKRVNRLWQAVEQ